MERLLVDVYRAKIAPDNVVRDLRQIDPRCELVYIGRGKWWLGLVDPLRHGAVVRAGQRLGEAIWQEGGASWPTLRLMQLKVQAFRKVTLSRERWPLEPIWGWVIETFRLQDWYYHHLPDSDTAWEEEYQRHVPERNVRAGSAATKLVEIATAERRIIQRRMQGGPLVTVLR